MIFKNDRPRRKIFWCSGSYIRGQAIQKSLYRTERYGADSHRPKEITYADTLEEDVLVS